MQEAQTSRLFAAMAAATRVRMIELLREGPLCVGALARRLGVTAGAASQHLAVLRAADLVRSRRRGYFIHYELNPAAMARWQRRLAALLAPLSAADGACCSGTEDTSRSEGKPPRSQPCAARRPSAASPKTSKRSPKNARRSRSARATGT